MASGPTPGAPRGSGLGLAIVETAAARMGARFTLERRQPCGELARLSFAAPPAA
ncbi:hypothetical protein [Cereibacter changlensis]|uniref:hypothetical protein n=1 Tax=Cereibacter changlensis TaxID=402884 RepID=UPI004033B989